MCIWACECVCVCVCANVYVFLLYQCLFRVHGLAADLFFTLLHGRTILVPFLLAGIAVNQRQGHTPNDRKLVFISAARLVWMHRTPQVHNPRVIPADCKLFTYHFLISTARLVWMHRTPQVHNPCVIPADCKLFL